MFCTIWCHYGFHTATSTWYSSAASEGQTQTVWIGEVTCDLENALNFAQACDRLKDFKSMACPNKSCNDLGYGLTFTHNLKYIYLCYSNFPSLETKKWWLVNLCVKITVFFGDWKPKLPCSRPRSCIFLSLSPSSLVLVWCHCKWSLWVGLDGIGSWTDWLLHHVVFWQHYRQMIKTHPFLCSVAEQSDLDMPYTVKRQRSWFPSLLYWQV